VYIMSVVIQLIWKLYLYGPPIVQNIMGIVMNLNSR
jgi:hypothetical protein